MSLAPLPRHLHCSSVSLPLKTPNKREKYILFVFLLTSTLLRYVGKSLTNTVNYFKTNFKKKKKSFFLRCHNINMEVYPPTKTNDSNDKKKVNNFAPQLIHNIRMYFLWKYGFFISKLYKLYHRYNSVRHELRESS